MRTYQGVRNNLKTKTKNKGAWVIANANVTCFQLYRDFSASIDTIS